MNFHKEKKKRKNASTKQQQRVKRATRALVQRARAGRGVYSAKAGRLREEFNFPFSFSALKLSRDKYFKCASIICISFLLHDRNMTHKGKNGFLQFSIIFLGSLRIEGKASS